MAAATLGPRTRALLFRSFLIYAALFFVGFLISILGENTQLQAFGLGLIFPGGGFAQWLGSDGWQFTIHLVLALTAFGAFIFGLFLWFATGNVIAPPAIWLATAIAASLMQHDPVWRHAKYTVPIFALTVLSTIVASYCLRIVLAARKHKTQPRELAAATIEFEKSRNSDQTADELSLADLQLMRTLYDRALQPLDQFKGFNHRDQFQTAALRYQLNLASYALSMFQYNHAPAFHGYLLEAQKNLILKNLNHKVWKFWELENIWGNLDRSADPCARDNIMFTGFLATQIAMFEVATGETTFSMPGSLTFEHPNGITYKHDANTMVQALFKNYETSKLGLMACEPNWVYPLCNTIGAAALKHFAPDQWQNLERKFQHDLDTEFRDPAGQFVPCRSAYTGFAVPTIGGAVGQAFPCFFLNATFPKIAENHWLKNRYSMITNGKLNAKHFWPVDVGNYGFSRASSFGASAAAANELGDKELASTLLERLDTECPSVLVDGIRHRARSSFWAHSAEVLARTTKANSLLNMMNTKGSSGPKLTGLIYPNTLVARARATQTGLEMVLYGSGKTQIEIIDLQPEQKYFSVDRDLNFKADTQGKAHFEISLNGRTHVHIEKRI